MESPTGSVIICGIPSPRVIFSTTHGIRYTVIINDMVLYHYSNTANVLCMSTCGLCQPEGHVTSMWPSHRPVLGSRAHMSLSFYNSIINKRHSFGLLSALFLTHVGVCVKIFIMLAA